MDFELQNELAELTHAARANELRRRELARKLGARIEDEATRSDRLSLMRIVASMASGRGVVDGVEAERSKENASIAANRTHDPFRIQLRPADLGWTRAVMQVGTGSMGGYMVGTGAVGFDALQDVSAVRRAGATVWDLKPGESVRLPGFTSSASAGWYSETGTATAGTGPTFSAIAASPKRCVAALSVSRKLLLQAPTVVEPLLNRHLLACVAQALDVAALAGTSGSTNPVGIPYLSGLGTTITGTGFTWSNALTLQQAVAASATNDANIRVVATPAVRATLSARQTGTGLSGYIWTNNTVAGMPAICTPNALANSIVVGDFTNLQVLTWGLELAANPYAAATFMADVIELKATLYADVVVPYPQAFAVGTGLS